MSECYAMYLNHKYSYRGHVFESRYKSCLVKEDAYFLQTSRYIHLNPVKAQMTNYPEDYPWSSYQTMIGLSDDRITEKIIAGQKRGIKKIIVPEANFKEASLVHGVEILGFYDLTGVVRYLEGKTSGIEMHMEENEKSWKNQKGFGFKDVKGTWMS